MKKFISLVLALVMALSLTTVAWGATTVMDETELKAALAAGGEVVLGANITLTTPADTDDLAVVPAGKTVNLDLAGYTISGTDTSALYSLIHVENGASLTIKDSVGTGKISYDAGTGNKTGVAVWVEGALTQKSGTIEITGDWVIGFAVDVRPNAWGIAYTEAASFTMDGGAIVASDSGVRVASNSSDSYPNLGVTFTMNGGTIDSAYDGIFVQNVSYDDTLTVEVVGGTVTSENTHAVRIYGNSDGKVDVEMSITGGSFTGEMTNLDQTGTGEVAISGGTFTDDVSAYLAAGVELDNGVVVPKGGASVTAKAYKMTSNGTLVPGDVNAIYAPAVAAVLNDDGKQTNTADISHYTFEGVNCVVAASLADADFVLYSDAAGKNVMMYLKAAVTSYNGTGAVYANFGKACGQVTYTAEVGKTYYTTNANGDAGIYVADKEGTKALMVGGKLVLVKAAPVAYTTNAVKHAAVPTVKDGKVIGYTCATCKLAAIEAPNFMSIPKGAVQDGLPGNWYWPVAVVTPSTDKVESAETFDAGIAMYVGMSVMAAAGSAVVLKKKD